MKIMRKKIVKSTAVILDIISSWEIEFALAEKLNKINTTAVESISVHQESIRINILILHESSSGKYLMLSIRIFARLKMD